MPLADRLIEAASDFKERPWGSINLRLNETFDAVSSTLFRAVPLPEQHLSVQNIRWIVVVPPNPCFQQGSPKCV